MLSSARWIRSNFRMDTELGDTSLNEAGEKPDDCVYSPISSINRIVVHHSATATGSARVFRAFHRAVNGWVDIGYHFVIGNGTMSEDGEVEEGRPQWAVGAHAREHNADTIGICLVGNFSDTYPTEDQMKSLGKLLKSLLSEYDLSSSSIILHRDLSGCKTVCPGENLTRKMIVNSISYP
ncbi:MAG: peptidoglycan recognition protein family protein [Candidatus Aegiribacteria sp.]|nr:peptidoglycan recognition protein family protein [Candidatus Aegiribacteria sp.]